MKVNLRAQQDMYNENGVPIKKGVIAILVVIVFVVLALFWGYGAYRINKVDSLAQTEGSIATTTNYLKKISEKMLLPVDKIPPRIMQIEDPEALIEKQSFYKGSLAGDIIVIFDESKKAILYSPRRDKIINVGPISYTKSEMIETDNTLNELSNLSNMP